MKLSPCLSEVRHFIGDLIPTYLSVSSSPLRPGKYPLLIHYPQI